MSQEVPRSSSVGSEDAVEPVRHWHPDFCSPQLLEGLCIQDEQESTLVLQEEEKGRVSLQRPWRPNLRRTETPRLDSGNT